MTSFEKYKKILIKNNPELTDDEIKKILEFLALIAKQAISRYKNELYHPKTLIMNGIMEKECGDLMKLFFENKR